MCTNLIYRFRWCVSPLIFLSATVATERADTRKEQQTVSPLEGSIISSQRATKINVFYNCLQKSTTELFFFFFSQLTF